MKLNTILLASAAMVAATGAQAQTATLYDTTDIRSTELTPITSSFYATSSLSTLSFSGYNVPSATYLYDPMVQLNGTGANLLTNVYTQVPGDSPDFGQDGSTLVFAGTDPNSPDTLLTNVATVAGNQYVLSFGLSSYSQPNRLTITATNASITPSTGAVPEPATWAMMLLGFGMIGFGMRYRRKSTKVSFA